MGKSRKELEHRQRRRYILGCAEKLFAEKGFDGVTVADIAEASEFSVGSIYLFFESKDALIRSLLLERVRQVIGIIDAELGKDIPAIEKLDRVIDGILEMFIEHIDYFKLYAMEVRGSEWCRPSDAFGDEFHKCVLKGYDYLADIFKQGIKEGTFKEDIEPLYMAFFLDASLNSLVEYILIKGEDLPIDKVRKGMQDILFSGILRKSKGRRK